MTDLKTLLNGYLNSLSQDELSDIMYEDYDTIVYWNGYKLGLDCVDHYGGEGMGDNYYTIIRFTHDLDEVYVKFDGWYASYDGATYEGYHFVEPKEVTRIEYV